MSCRLQAITKKRRIKLYFHSRMAFEQRSSRRKSVESVAVVAVVWLCSIFELCSAQSTKVCSPLPYASLPNGDIFVTGYQTLRFKCKDGYYLGGPSQIRCYKGEWSSTTTPVCWEKDGRCDPPPKITNGRTLGGDNHEVGSVVLYMCDPGYSLIGESRRTCLPSGYWSGITPVCMGDAEPLQNIAERLDAGFVQGMEVYAQNDSVQKARYLDDDSVKRGLELVVVVDRSSSIDPQDLELGKNFLKAIFEEFNVKNGDNPNGARVAVIAFGSEVSVLFNTNDGNITDSATASRMLDELLKPGGGGTALAPALIAVHIHVESQLRKDAKKALLLITDGAPNIGGEGASPEDLADGLKAHYDFEIFAMGIGLDVNRTLLAKMASEPISSHLFLLADYKDMSTLMSIIKNKPTEAPPVSPEKCGRLASKRNNWPWMAAVYVSFRDSEGNKSSAPTELKLCAGVLICRQWVLTAASCFFRVQGRAVSLSRRETFVVLGEYNLLKMDKNQENFYTENVILHEDFDPLNELYNNVALIKLHRPVKMGVHRTICLPPTDRPVPLHLDPSLNVSVAGWGTSSPSKKPSVPSVSHIKFTMGTKLVGLTGEAQCRHLLRNRIYDKTIFCAETAIPDQCTGIMGSPAVAEDPKTGTHHVLGILSYRNGCDRGHSEYAELTKHVKWINNITEKCHFNHWN